VPRNQNAQDRRKDPDIRAVAAVAKVSIATVSRTINGSPLVSERLSKARLAGHQAAQLLSQHPCAQPRLRPQPHSRHHRREHHQSLLPELIQSFEEIAVAHGYEILVSSTNSDPAVLAPCVRRMLERKVEGVAV
jgi:DNA-binding LacI/PurR family transcriptional regulator